MELVLGLRRSARQLSSSSPASPPRPSSMSAATTTTNTPKTRRRLPVHRGSGRTVGGLRILGLGGSMRYNRGVNQYTESRCASAFKSSASKSGAAAALIS
ncbi:MAG: hypothetical protein ACLUI3_10210 [Christensenellales bacterium]